MNWFWQTVIGGVVSALAGIAAHFGIAWLNRKKVQQERLESAVNELHREIDRLVAIVREATKKPMAPAVSLVADSRALERQWKVVCCYLPEAKVVQLQIEFANAHTHLNSHSNLAEQALTDFQRKLDFIASTDR